MWKLKHSLTSKFESYTCLLRKIFQILLLLVFQIIFITFTLKNSAIILNKSILHFHRINLHMGQITLHIPPQRCQLRYRIKVKNNFIKPIHPTYPEGTKLIFSAVRYVPHSPSLPASYPWGSFCLCVQFIIRKQIKSRNLQRFKMKIRWLGIGRFMSGRNKSGSYISFT